MVSKLKEYKELISILIFFLGGFFWIDSQFPKKADLTAQVSGVQTNVTKQVEVLECLLEQYMLLTQLQISAQDTEEMISDLKADLVESHMGGDGTELANLSPAMLIERDEIAGELAKQRAALAKIEQEITEIRAGLERQSCRSGNG